MSSFLRIVALALLTSLPVSTAIAAGATDDLNRGPKVGAQIPHDLNLEDQNGQRMNYMSRARAKGLIILFSRSVGW